jgi:hypothetical protein
MRPTALLPLRRKTWGGFLSSRMDLNSWTSSPMASTLTTRPQKKTWTWITACVYYEVWYYVGQWFKPLSGWCAYQLIRHRRWLVASQQLPRGCYGPYLYSEASGLNLGLGTGHTDCSIPSVFIPRKLDKRLRTEYCGNRRGRRQQEDGESCLMNNLTICIYKQISLYKFIKVSARIFFSKKITRF